MNRLPFGVAAPLTVLLFAALLGGCQDEPLRVGGFCATGADCPANQACAGGLCVGTCAGDADCPEGEVCRNDVCLPSCASNEECSSAPEVNRACVDSACEPFERPGIADVGSDRAVDEGEAVLLSGADSFAFDPATTYKWELIASNPKGVQVTLQPVAQGPDLTTPQKADSVAARSVTFTSPSVTEDTTLRFRMTMQDPDGNNVTAEVEITVRNSINEPPVATAQASLNEAAAGDVVTLSAVGSGDPNPSDALTYEWSYVLDPEDDSVVVELDDISDEGDLSKVAFTAPALSQDTIITFTLTVSDGVDTTTTTLSVLVFAKVAPTCDPALCDDGDPCTEDGCIPLEGCTHEPLSDVPCDDGDACTTGDACADGVCKASPLDCDDDDPCTTDSCAAGECAHANNAAPCDDGDACTLDDACKAGACVGVALECDDSNFCTDDACVEGACVNAPNSNPCDDGNVCTKGDACVAGACKGNQLPCDDGNPCTNDGCSQGTCVHLDNTAECEDGNACTTQDSCAGASCKPGLAVSCDDGNACTADSCVPATGCAHEGLSDKGCDDEDKCTKGDVCTEGTCIGVAVSCDDGNPCTDDACTPDEGCASVPNEAACDDSDPCTLGDVCSEGACLAGAELDLCDDSDACTADACVPLEGCANEPVFEVACDDGDPCTVDDLCAEGGCIGGGPLPCDDENVCTFDVCIDGVCEHAPADGGCDDGTTCTTDDACEAGVCVGKTVCTDQNPCTDSTCEEIEGSPTCEFVPRPLGAACLDDAGLCTWEVSCKKAEVHTFMPAGAPEGASGALTGATGFGFSLAATGGAVWSDEVGDERIGTIWTLSPGAAQQLEYERPGEVLFAIDQTMAVGEGAAVSRYVDGIWMDDPNTTELLPAADLLSVWEGLSGPFGETTETFTLGLDAVAEPSGIATCTPAFGEPCVFEWPLAQPMSVVRLDGHTAPQGDDQIYGPSPLIALAEDGAGSVAMLWKGPGTEGWLTESPYGCTAGAPDSPCATATAWSDVAVAGPFEAWVAERGPMLFHLIGGVWSPETIGGLPPEIALETVVIKGLATMDGVLFVAAEVPGCGAGGCISDPSWKAHLLVAWSDGAWQERRVLAARQCATPDDPAQCAADLELFSVNDIAWSDFGVAGVVGSDLVYEGDVARQRMLAYLLDLVTAQ